MTSFTKHRFHVLDGMRGISAILVMIYHYYGLAEIQPQLRCLKNEFIAVDFFFMLSGFVILHAYGEKLRNGLTVSGYVARRIGRLYPTMAFGILLGLPVLYINATLTPGDYTRHDLVSTVISNLAMLPYITGKKLLVEHGSGFIGLFPSDTALWSIAFEMLASLSFVGLYRLRERHLRTFCIGWLCLLIIGSFFHGFAGRVLLFDMDGGHGPENLLLGFPRLFYGFSAGMLIYVWRFKATPQKLVNSRRSISPLLLYGALIVTLIFPSHIQGVYDLFAVAVLAPLLVWFGSISKCSDRLTTSASEFLGWISFPLYCLHVPVFEGIKRFNLAEGIGISPQLAAILASFTLSIVVGVVIDRLRLQRTLASILGRSFAALAR